MDYQIVMPTLAEFPQFIELADDPKKLIAELLKVSVWKDGVFLGDKIPLQDVVPLMTHISGLLFPGEKNE